MPPRLGHRKSRRGCLRCKQRRVKCDEKLPCGACVRHSVECIYDKDQTAQATPSTARRSTSPLSRRVDQRTSRSPVSRAGSGTSTRTPVSGNENASAATPTLSDASPAADPLAALAIFRAEQSSFPSSSQWLTDLGLMHHFTTVTWETLPESIHKEEVWRLSIPRLAEKYDFLMHQILAIAASHKAYLNPFERESSLVQASQHQNSAIQGLREVVSDITESNCHAVLATASLLSLSALARNGEHTIKDTLGPTLPDLCEFFNLVRGMHQILKRWEDYVKKGPLHGLLKLVTFEPDVPMLNSIMEDLKTWRAPPEVNAKAQALLEKEAWTLADWTLYVCGRSESPALKAVTTWPLTFSEQFLELVKDRNRGALEILDQYCRILESAGSQHWFTSGWGSSVRNDIAQSLHYASAS